MYYMDLSPMDGIGPEDINIPTLIDRLKDEEVKELILAMNPNLEGESTAMYISRLVKPIGIKSNTSCTRIISWWRFRVC